MVVSRQAIISRASPFVSLEILSPRPAGLAPLDWGLLEIRRCVALAAGALTLNPPGSLVSAKTIPMAPDDNDHVAVKFLELVGGLGA